MVQVPAVAPVLPVGGGGLELGAFSLWDEDRGLEVVYPGGVRAAVLGAADAFDGMDAQLRQAGWGQRVVAVDEQGLLASLRMPQVTAPR